MSNKDVFNFNDYKKYLASRLPTKGDQRGSRSKLAITLGCKTTFISRVFSGLADFSLEHGIKINDFLEHTYDESHFFLLLLQKARSGSRDLTLYFEKQIQHILDERAEIAKNIQTSKTNFNIEDQQQYYSSWIYSAIHILVMIPEFQTKQSIADYLKIPLNSVTEPINLLLRSGLIKEEKGRYIIGSNRLHLPKNSPLVYRHHINWHLKALQAIDRKSDEDSFYTGIISISKLDAKIIRQKMIEFITSLEPIIQPSKEEAAHCMVLDWFKL